MCAINGFNFKDPELILKMNKLTAHRGPDATATWVGERVTFGHNRLAIIDLSERGAQPMWDGPQEIVITYNGEIYNYKELRQALSKKYQFRSESDTEVILYAYREYGVECFKKLNGIFALAIWDTHRTELILARDHVGVNPLYYYWDGERFIFSSEIKAILAHPVPRAVDPLAFNLYFQLLYVPEPHTMFRGIGKVPPAHYLVLSGNKLSLTRYWQVTDFSNLPSRREAVEQTQTLFRDSVRGQLVSDRPVGIFLSGGLDSTAVLGAVAEHHRGRIKTYSVGFKDSLDPAKFNADFLLARATAKHYDTDHRELMIGPEDIERELENIVWHLDEPNANPTAGAMFLLSRLAKQEVAVALGGDGGDELFGGYPRYYYSAWISAFQRLPTAIQAAVKGLFSLAGRAKAAAKLTLPPAAARLVGFLAQKPALLQGVLNPSSFNSSAAEEYLAKKYFFPPAPVQGDFEKLFMQVDRQSWLVDESLLRTNKMSMAFGLEPRVPILDYRLVEMSARIPTAWKLSQWQRPGHWQGKMIWREAIDQYLPPHIRRQQKRGWFTPMSKWLRVGLKNYASEILSPANLPADYFNSAGLAKVWQDHLHSRQYNLNIIWASVMWVRWHQKFIKR